jgi:hypothetical protein
MLVIIACGVKLVQTEQVQHTQMVNELGNDIRKVMEKAYFEGQWSATHGDIRYKVNKDSTITWTKSPWDNGRTPLYTPNIKDAIIL